MLQILDWQHLSVPIVEKRLRFALQGWEGTPYREGDQMQGIGVDCVRFVCGVLDEMYGYRRELPRNLPSDRALHDRDGAIAAMKQLRRLYEPVTEVTDGKVEPGDIVVSGPRGGGPGHALIAGFDPFTLWHVDPAAGVCSTGIALTDMDIFEILRPSDKHLWL